jgi:hypothetical protein
MLFTTAGQLLGIVLASYGLIRESFATLAQSRPYGEGRFGEGRFGGTLGRLADSIVAAAVIVRLLPKDGSLTLTDRKRNAALAILGTAIATLSLAFEFGQAIVASRAA